MFKTRLGPKAEAGVCQNEEEYFGRSDRSKVRRWFLIGRHTECDKICEDKTKRNVLCARQTNDLVTTNALAYSQTMQSCPHLEARLEVTAENSPSHFTSRACCEAITCPKRTRMGQGRLHSREMPPEKGPMHGVLPTNHFGWTLQNLEAMTGK
jgi:hypothetical protein